MSQTKTKKAQALTDPDNTSHEHLRILLESAVALNIREVKKNGFISDYAWEQVGEFGHDLAEHGDLLLYAGKPKGEAARLFNRLAECLAVMAFIPCGISFAGMHWEETLDAVSHYDDRLNTVQIIL